MEEDANEASYLKDHSKMYLTTKAKKRTQEGDFIKRAVCGSQSQYETQKQRERVKKSKALMEQSSCNQSLAHKQGASISVKRNLRGRKNNKVSILAEPNSESPAPMIINNRSKMQNQLR